MNFLISLLYSLNPLHGARQRSLLSVMAVATQRNVPLSACIKGCMKSSLAPLWNRTILHLLKQLELGTNLDRALLQSRPAVSDSALLTIRVGANCGDITEGLRCASAAATRRHRDANSVMGIWGYLLVCVLGLAVVSAVTFNAVVRPDSVFDQFSIEPPSYVEEMKNFADSWSVLVTLFVVISLAVLATIHPLAFDASHGLASYQGRLVIPSWQLRLASCDILLSLSTAARRSKPFKDYLAAIGEFHPRPRVRRAVEAVAAGTESGLPIGECLHAQKFISLAERQLIDAADETGNLEWALQFTAQRIETRINRSVDMSIAIARPVVIGIFAGAVLFWGYALFGPLTRLIGGG